ncbi:hypothetical protein H5410_050374, partial [Solanum commersonii]
MKQRESSRIRNKETREIVPVGTLTYLANQKKLLLARRRKDLLIEKRQRLTGVIEEQDLLESHNPEAGVRIQADSTNNVVQPVEEQLQLNSTALEGNEQYSSTKKRQRGQTKMLSVHGRHDRKLIVLNKVGQPVGPSNDVVIELSNFLENWKLLDTKKDLWDYTKEKYDIPEIGNRWTLKTIQESWRRRKFDLKSHHFDAYTNDQIRMEKKPDDVPTSQFKELLKYWNSEKISSKKRKPNQSYKDTYEDTTTKIAEMENIEMQQNEYGNETIDAFASVMGSEHPGHLRLYERGVTKTTMKRKVGNLEASSNATNDFVKKMEDRMLRMEEKIEEQKEQFDQQKTTMRQEIVKDVITKLQHSGLPIDVNVLATLLDVSSTRETNIRPIHRSSTSSNNQGQNPPPSFSFSSTTAFAVSCLVHLHLWHVICSLSASSPGANSSKCLLVAKLSSSVYTVITIYFQVNKMSKARMKAVKTLLKEN